MLDGRNDLWRTPTQRESGAGWRGKGRWVATVEVPGYAVNDKLELDEQHKALGGWRGPLSLRRVGSSYRAHREPTERERHYPLWDLASRIVDNAFVLAQRELNDTDVASAEWECSPACSKALLADLMGIKEPEEQAKAIGELAGFCVGVLEKQPAVPRVAAPLKVFGDLHGQFRDMLMLFAVYGFPTHLGGDVQTTSYIFNGDFVDRGAHQLECVVLLFALKALYAEQVYLLRGNHEFREQNMMMREEGFFGHLATRYSEQGCAGLANTIFEDVHKCFDWLPLAAIAADTALVVHGGIGDGTWGIGDLETIERPVKDVDSSKVLLQAMWSDPTGSDSVMKSGVHQSDRGEGVPEFGPNVSASFCAENKLAMIIRSHQFMRAGFKVMHHGFVVCVFSARNYFFDEGGTNVSNDCAILLLTQDRTGNLRVYPKCLEAAPETTDATLAVARASSRRSARGAGGAVEGMLLCGYRVLCRCFPDPAERARRKSMLSQVGKPHLG